MTNKFYKSDLAIFLGALIFIIGSLTLAGVILFGWDIFKKFLSEGGSGWAQAIGSILAVWVALFSTQRQHEYEQSRKHEENRKERIRKLEILGALLSDLAGRCRQGSEQIASYTEIPLLQAEFLKVPRSRIESIPILDLPDEGFALIFNELILKLESAEIAISALQISNNKSLFQNVSGILNSIETRALEGFYEVTRLQSELMNSDEKKNIKKTKFRPGVEAKEFIEQLKENQRK